MLRFFMISNTKKSFLKPFFQALIEALKRTLKKEALTEKKSFILIEIFIAISLLSTCALPLVSSSMKAFKKRREGLIKLELERKAELLYYQFLKENVSTVIFENIPKQNLKAKQNLEAKEFKTFVLSIDNQKLTFYPHYHLYHKHNNPQEMMTARCKICIPKDKGNCKEHSYEFVFFAKKVAENSVDQHGKNKENTLENHERLPSNIQTPDPSE